MKKILILGAGEWQVAYIKKAKELGLYVYATDWSENPVGKVFADEFKTIDVQNKEKSLDYALENNIDAIFTNSDVAVQTAAYIAEKMSLPCYSTKQAEIATNKYEMRKALQSIGLPTPKFILCNSIDETFDAFKTLNSKIIIKPIDNCGSRGVYIVDNEDYLKEVYADTFANSFSGKILVEEFMIGNESSVEVLLDNGKIYILGWCRKQKSPYPYRYDIQLDYFPDNSAKENLMVSEMVNQLVQGLKLENGILHIEFMWTADELRIIEFALRGCGSNVITHLMPEIRGFDIMKFLLYKSLGVDNPINFINNAYGTLKFIIPSPGVVKNVEGLVDIKNLDYIIDFSCDIKNGDYIDIIKNGRNRPGYYIIKGESREDISKKIENIENIINIQYS